MTRAVALIFVGCAIAVTPVTSQDSTEEADSGPWKGAQIRLMRHADAVYIFSVKENSRQTPNQKDLRRLGPEARQALVDMLCNVDNFEWLTGVLEDCEPYDVGLLFQKSKGRLILRFCSVCDRRVGCRFDKIVGEGPPSGCIKQRPWELWKQRFAQAEMRK
jgi:hypothetical protein